MLQLYVALKQRIHTYNKTTNKIKIYSTRTAEDGWAEDFHVDAFGVISTTKKNLRG